MTFRGVEFVLQASCKHQQNRVAFFPVFRVIPTEFTVTELCDDNVGT